MADKPKMILVMRHGEKSDDPDDPDLTAAGQARAIKLPTFIPQQFGEPDFIFAAAITVHVRSSPAGRATVEPRASRSARRRA